MQRLLLPFKEFRLAAHKRKTTYTGKHTQSEMCTAKSAYNTLAISYAQLHPPPTIPTQTIDILKQVWKDKSMRPRIKTFAWRILREAIPTGNRIQSIVSKADGSVLHVDNKKQISIISFIVICLELHGLDYQLPCARILYLWIKIWFSILILSLIKTQQPLLSVLS